MDRLILVSNRLPVTLRRVEGERRLVPSAGGLVAGLMPLHEAGDGLWIGTLGASDTERLRPQMEKARLVDVPLPEEQARRHYEGFSNRVLWPLFHYFVDSVDFDAGDFAAYRAVNERFANVVAEHAGPGDLIWIHDYQLMMVPQLLRERLPDARIGFFCHVPFPSSEVFSILPVAAVLLEGLLGADVVGFHTYDYARHFVTSARRLLGIEFDEDWIASRGEESRVGVYPLGVDAVALRERAHRPQVKRRLESLRRELHGRKVILGIDRLDYTKGLPQRLKAYRRLLETQPDWRAGAVLLQVAVPSRTTIGTYRALKDDVERRVGEINGAHSAAGQVPIWYMYRSVTQDELSALYQLADVALVTPLRDGMNLIAKEYVASRLDGSGVLVLSKFAGAASTMGEALLVNPWDVQDLAAVLDRALRMSPEEQAQRMAALSRRVEKNDVRRWANRFVDALRGSRRKGRVGEWRTGLERAFARARHPLVALDYDGTLADIVPTPQAAAPDETLLDLLQTLARLQNVEVMLVSGRDQKVLEKWFGHIGVHLAAEHGLWLRERGHSKWRELVPRSGTAWINPVREILEDYAARTPGSLIEDKGDSIAWHYRQVEPAFGTWQARELLNHLSEAFANSPIQVLHGSRVVEVRRQGVHKGVAYRGAVEAFGPFDLVLAAGDDRTDEDLFSALPPDAWSIKVGSGPTHARYRAESVRALRYLLVALSKARHAAARRTTAPGFVSAADVRGSR